MPSDAAIASAGKVAQDRLKLEVVRSSAAVWKLLDPRKLASSTPSWSVVMLEIIRAFRTTSADNALRTYNQLRPGYDWLEPTPWMDSDRIVRSLYVTGPGRTQQLINDGMKPQDAHKQAFQLVARSATSAVANSGRELTESAIHHDELALGFARIPSANACAFCLLLASRGAVYSKSTVLTTTGRSKKRGAGKSFHEGCNCSMFPVFSRDQELPDRIAQANDLYVKASKEASGTKEILAEMRKQGGVR